MNSLLFSPFHSRVLYQLAALHLSFGMVAEAAEIVVNNVGDPAGFNPAITIAQLGATVTLRDAVNAANNTPGDDDITFAPALAGQTILLSQVGITTGFGPSLSYSALDINSTIRMRGLPSGVTISREASVQRLRLMWVSGNGNLTLDGLTLRDGLEMTGAAVHNTGTLTVGSSTLRNCTANVYTALAGFARGGAIFNAGTLSVAGSNFLNNNAAITGGAIYNASELPLSVSDTVFSNCVGFVSGGAIANANLGGPSTVANCTFTNNRVLGSTNNVDQDNGFGGGAIRNQGALTVNSSTFDGNSSDNAFNGGAISNSGNLHLNANMFLWNAANSPNNQGFGGALANLGQVTATNCTFTQNRAFAGTAIDSGIGSTITLNHCTVANQQVPTDGGAAVRLLGISTITNSIISRNFSFSTSANGNVQANVSGSFGGNHNLINEENPGVGDPGDHGGPTHTMPLLPGSPAIDTGVATAGVTADQRGVARPQGAGIDIGAFENGATPPIFTSASETNFFIGTTNRFQVTASGNSELTASASGTLPAGVSFNSTGVLSGMPSPGTEGTYPLLITAANSAGQTTRSFRLVVIQTDLLVTTAVDEDDGSTAPALGTGTSLREAFNRAMQTGGSPTIVFSPALAGQTILCTIGTGLETAFRVSTNVTIQGLTGGRGITIARGAEGNLRGFYVEGGTLTLNDLTLANWRSGSEGGAIFCQGHVRLHRCTLRNNFASSSGAAIMIAGGVRSGYLENCTIANNEGSPAITSSANSFEMKHVTVTGNTGGGLNIFQFPIVRNSIIAGNTAGGNPADISGGGLRSVSSNNLIGTGGGLVNGSDGNVVGVPADQIHLAPLADNGGPTQTVALLPGSPAINAASADSTTDQRGIVRPQVGAPDIGAFELVSMPSLVVTTPTDENNGTSDPGFGIGTSLREALVAAQSPFSHAGFGLSGSGWTLNGSSVSAGGSRGLLDDVLTLTPATTGQANSAWLNQKVNVTNFSASFRYTQNAGAGGADGFTFTLQNTGTQALGAAGGGLGYGGIGQSVAFAFNIFGGNPSGAGFAVYTNGNVTGAYTTPANGVSLTNSQPVDISIASNGTSVTLTMTQGTNVSTTTFENLDLAALVGGGTAYVGFTGATGGAVALQQVSRFQFSGAPAGTAVTFDPALAGETITLSYGWTDANDPSALQVSGQITLQGLTTSPGVTIAMAEGVQKRHLYIAPDGSLTVQNLTFTGGRGPDFGGSIWSQGSLTVRGCTFTGNTAGQEGGAIQSWGNSPLLAIENSTFSGNHSNGIAGAIDCGASSMSLRHLTITQNTATFGSALVVWGNPLTITNSIVANNPDDGISLVSGGTLNSQSTHNLLGSGGTGGLVDGASGNRTGISSTQLRLGPLSNNGGPTPTLALLPGSLAIHAGLADPGILADQRGSQRPSGPAPDIGAFEYPFPGELPYWREIHGLAANGSQDLANPSGDGVASLLKYAFNMAPNGGDLTNSDTTILDPITGTAGLPAIRPDAQGRLTITFLRRTAVSNPGISYEVLTGEDLSNLQPLSLSGATIHPINATWERVTITDPAATAKRFGRLQINSL